MPNPYYTAQENAAMDPSQANLPAGGAPSYPAPAPTNFGGAPYPDPQQGVPAQGAYQDEIGGLRDSILSQFPDVMAPDEAAPEMDTGQKLTLFGLFLANPKGALDMVRERRERQAKRQALRAELGLKATGVAGTILKAQSDSQEAILNMHLAANRDWRERKTAEFNEQIQRGQLAVSQSRAALEGRRYADEQQFRDQALGGGGPQLQPGEGAMLDPGTPNPVTGEAGGQSVPPDVAQSMVPPQQPGGLAASGGRRTVTVGPRGASVTIAPGRDASVDFDSWVGKRFGSLGPPPNVTAEQLVAMYQKERQALASIRPGTFGAASGAPIGGAGAGSFEGQPGYDDLSGDAIESYGR